MYSRREILFVSAIIVFTLICAVVPYLYGYFHTPSGMAYLGIRLNNFPDTNSYLNWITQGSEGNLLFKQLYSIDGEAKTFFHPVFLILGIFMRFFGGEAILWYHMGRIVGAALLLFSGYSIISYLVNEKRWRIIAFVIFIFSSGLGWLFNFSADNTQIEATNFINIYESLVNTFSVALILWTIIFFYYKKCKTLYSIAACIVLLNLLILIHSYDFIVVVAILFLASLYHLLKHKDFNYLGKFLYIVAGCFPSLFIQLYTLNTNAALGIWATIQSSVPAVPNLFYYISGVGLQVIFLTIGVIKLSKDKREEWLPWLIWLFLLPLFLWNPLLIRFQRKLAIGAFIPITLFTFVGIKWWYTKTREHIKTAFPANLALIALIILLSLTNVTLIVGDISYIKNLDSLYITQGLYSGIDYLRTQPNAVVLATPFVSNIIPSLTGNTVYAGHYDQTVDYSQKFNIVYQVFSSNGLKNDPLKFLILQEGITHILVDSEIQARGGLDTSNRPYLKLVYENSDVKIYQVEKELLH